MPHACYLDAISLLLSEGIIDLIEWSFDMGWGSYPLPSLVQELLDQFGRRDRLIGHGVEFSLLSAEWTPSHEKWLSQLRQEVQARHYHHISEHFGFMIVGDFLRGAPLPVPLTSESLALGRERLQLLGQISQAPIGLENLALALGPKDVAEQGHFLDLLLEPVDGFLLLDLHNLYCQIHNFSVPAQALLDSYPLQRVREIHVSGGSWSESLTFPGRTIRRDTHDHQVPSEVLDLLELTLPQCPNLEFVVLERMGHTLDSDQEVIQFQKDYRKIRKRVELSFHAHCP